MKKLFELFVIAGLRIAKIPGHLSGICHLFGPGGGEFVRKPLPESGA